MASLGLFLAGQGHPHATRQSGHPQNDPTMLTIAAVAVVSFRGKVKPDTRPIVKREVKAILKARSGKVVMVL